MSAPDPINVAAWVGRLAHSQPDRLAVAEPSGTHRGGQPIYRHWTFQDLHAHSDRYAAGLASLGLRRGMRAALLAKPSLPFFGLVFALFKLGAVPVLIDPGIGIRNFGRCLNEARPEAFIGVPAAHIARLLLGWGKSTVRVLLTIGRKLGWGGATLADFTTLGEQFTVADVQPADTAAILFTSGSTGPPKGAVYTHGMFSAQVRLLKQLFGLQPGEIDLCTFPLFALFAPALGWSAIIPRMDFTRPGSVNPHRIREAISHWSVTNLFGSPALLERVADTAVREGWHFPSLRRVISAGAPVRPAILDSFSSLLEPGVPIHTPYGATEALPLASIASAEILGETAAETARGQGNCVGRPAPEMAVRIIRITDAPVAIWTPELELPPGEIGEIAVQGPVVSQSYDARPEATSLAKITDPAGGFWHRMGDVGWIDEKGRLWFCGRKSHRVVLPDRTLFTLPCEGVFNAHPSVRRTALVGVVRRGRTEPVVCVELKKGIPRRSREAVAADLCVLASKHEHTRIIQTFLFHPGFPVDIRHNAKIYREKLAVWAAKVLK